MLGHAAAMSKTSASSAQGLPNPFTSLWNGGREVLRSMSYHEMKNRAGIIGRNGLGPMIGKLSAANAGIRVHLMGHSFGARLVAYSLSGLPAAATGVNSPVKTLLLIQGAFSHFAFANPVPDFLVSGPGALWNVAGNVNGPLLATFTAADRASTCSIPTQSSVPISHRSAAPTAISGTPRWSGR